MTKWWPFFDFL